jgi:membrane-associated protease RseP (regulator of RpoE activity)
LAPPLGADDGKKVESKAHQVPFKLTNTKHVLVRAKINGKGPYNFIIDTGAPALFVSTAVAKKLGVKPDKKGWGTFDRFDLEGGVSLAKFKGRIEDPFQLQGMNALGLAGAELHGIIGYMVLAKFKIELDFTRDKMTWTPSKFQPPPPEGLGGRGGAPAELDALGGVMKFLGAFLGKKPEADITTRGLLGIDLIDESVGVVVKTVFEKGPAARAGLKAGDLIVEFQGRTVRDYDGLQKLAAKVSAGDTVKLTIKREGKKQTITFKSEEGL